MSGWRRPGVALDRATAVRHSVEHRSTSNRRKRQFERKLFRGSLRGWRGGADFGRGRVVLRDRLAGHDQESVAYRPLRASVEAPPVLLEPELKHLVLGLDGERL